MSIAVAPLKIKGAIRQEAIEQVQAQIQSTVLNAVGTLIMAFLEAEVEAVLGRAKYAPRTVASSPRVSEWRCAGCSNNDANNFRRDGHYKRTLATQYGHLAALKVPMLECQVCQHDIVCQWSILAKWQRFWWDFSQRLVTASALGQSLRHLRDEWSATLGSSVGLRNINQRINAVQALVEQSHRQALTCVPEVVQFDGIWFNLMQPKPCFKLDKRGRKRHLHTGKRQVLLIALGLWADGRRQILDWQIADSESEEAWTTLLNRLWERGLTAQNGLKLILRDGGTGLGEAFDLVYSGEVVEQRCIFHKLRNMSRHLKRGVSRKTDPVRQQAQAEARQKLIEQASQIYAAPTAVEATARLATWVAVWEEQEPKAVENLQSDFEQTLGYYQLEGISWNLIRTTSLLERSNRELRRKLRQVGSFGSEVGAEAGVYLQVERLNAAWQGQSWQDVSQVLCLRLLELNP